MSVITSVEYDPAVAVTNKATSSLLAMTALDTTNLRLTFTAPASGKVLVRLRGAALGGLSAPQIFFGVLDGSTVILRQTPMGSCYAGGGLAATGLEPMEVMAVIGGLSGSYTWDAAYGVDVVVASTNIVYGGPDNNSGANAYGAFTFEIWDATNCLANALYDPASAATAVTTSLLAMTALDTTNLRCTFTAPASGKVQWRLRTNYTGSTTAGQVLLGVISGGAVVGRCAPLLSAQGSNSAVTRVPMEASGVITGLTPGNSYTYDAAYAVQVVSGAGGGLKWGGPNNTTTNDAWGATTFSVWTA